MFAGATAPQDCAIAQLRERIWQNRPTRSILHSQLSSSLASVGGYLELGTLLLDPVMVLTLERLEGPWRRLLVLGGTGIEPEAQREWPGGSIAVHRGGAGSERLHALRMS